MMASQFKGTAPAGLVGLWTADGNTFDGLETDGTLIGGATYAPGISGEAFSFDGVSGAFQDSTVYSPPVGRILYPLGATMEAWIKTTATSGTLMTDGGGVATQSGMGLFLQNGDLVGIGSDGTAGQFNFELTSPTTVNDGQWHLVAVTWDGTTAAGGVTLYVDGAAVASGTALSTIGSSPFDNGASSLLYFGGDPSLPLPYYQGLMDEVGVYSLALGASDIAGIFNLRGLAQSTGAAQISGNQIGTNADGTAAVGNGHDGVDLVGSSSNTIGGSATTPGTGLGNLISGNTGDGVEIAGVGATGNVVAGNLIGLNAAGASALGNAGDGVTIDTSASHNTIGGAAASARNVISGNLNGVEIVGATSIGNVVQGDFIGTDLAGMTSIGNVDSGIVSSGTSGEFGGATDDGHGNPAPGSAPGNLIAGSSVDLYLLGTSDVVAGNLIGLNATGTAPLDPGTFNCVNASGADNIIGGLSPDDRNIITGAFIEISIAGSGTQVLNNFIGTDPTGTIALEHIGQSGDVGYGGIWVYGAGPGTVIVRAGSRQRDR